MTRTSLPGMILASCALVLLTACSGSDATSDATEGATGGSPAATSGDTAAPSGDPAAPSGGAAEPGPTREEAEALVKTTALIAQSTADYLNQVAPNATSEEVNAAIAAGSTGLFERAGALSVEPAKVLTLAVNFQDMQAPPDPASMQPITTELNIDVLFVNEFTCTVALPNVATAPGSLQFSFNAGEAVSNGSIRCGK